MAIFLLLAGCTRESADGAALLSEVRRTLAEREGRLHSYQLAAESKEGDAVAKHAFFFRSPNKMRGAVLHPARLEWSFDGTHLYKLEPSDKRFSTFELKLPAEKAAVFLNSTFAPFVSEGFRTPLLPSKGVKATKIQHPRGPDAVELKVELGPAMSTRYVLRWPSGDFLSRTTEASGQVSERRMEEEQCDATLKLCLPKVTTERTGDEPPLTTKVTELHLNLDLAADDFAPKAPEGWSTETHQVVEAD